MTHFRSQQSTQSGVPPLSAADHLPASHSALAGTSLPPTFQPNQNALSPGRPSERTRALHEIASNETISVDDRMSRLAFLWNQDSHGFSPGEMVSLVDRTARLFKHATAPQKALTCAESVGNRLLEPTVSGDSSVSLLSARELSRTAWSFATLSYPHPPLFREIARHFTNEARSKTPQDLANTSWAFAKTGHRDENLLNGIARDAVNQIMQFKPQEISNLVWSFATLQHNHPQLFTVVATRCTGD